MNPPQQSLKKEDFKTVSQERRLHFFLLIIFVVSAFCMRYLPFPSFPCKANSAAFAAFLATWQFSFLSPSVVGFSKKKEKEKGELRGTALAYI